MPSFSPHLEKTLHRALDAANDRSHEYATLEHLLLSLVDDPEAVAVFKACEVNVEILRAQITEYLYNELQNLHLPSKILPCLGWKPGKQMAISSVG